MRARRRTDAMRHHLIFLYGEAVGRATFDRMVRLLDRYGDLPASDEHGLTERDAVWITYGDQFRAPGEAPLRTLADPLQHESLELVTRSGFWEYYDPRDGSGCGSPQFSWSAALAIDIAAHT